MIVGTEVDVRVGLSVDEGEGTAVAVSDGKATGVSVGGWIVGSVQADNSGTNIKVTIVQTILDLVIRFSLPNRTPGPDFRSFENFGNLIMGKARQQCPFPGSNMPSMHDQPAGTRPIRGFLSSAGTPEQDSRSTHSRRMGK